MWRPIHIQIQIIKIYQDHFPHWREQMVIAVTRSTKLSSIKTLRYERMFWFPAPVARVWARGPPGARKWEETLDPSSAWAQQLSTGLVLSPSWSPDLVHDTLILCPQFSYNCFICHLLDNSKEDHVDSRYGSVIAGIHFLSLCDKKVKTAGP